MAGWYTLDLTASERKVLETIWAATDKVATYADISKAVRLTPRGLRIVLNRMDDRSLLAMKTGVVGRALTITWKGMQALGVSAKDAA